MPRRKFTEEENIQIVKLRHGRDKMPWRDVARILKRSESGIRIHYHKNLNGTYDVNCENEVTQLVQFKAGCTKYAAKLDRIYGIGSKPFSDGTSKTTEQPLTKRGHCDIIY